MPEYRSIYLALLITIFIQHFVLGYCILTVWEYSIRKKMSPSFNKAGKNFIAMNLKRFFGIDVTNRFVDISQASFLVGMIIVQSVLL